MVDVPNVPPSHIVGGDGFYGRGYYDGRGQTMQYFAETEDELIGRVTEAIRQVKADWGRNADWKFPDKNLWEIRIWP